MDLRLDQYLDVMRRDEGSARSLGRTFRLEREKLGKCLSDISEETHIPERFLQAIEAGDIRSIPGGDLFYEDFGGDHDVKSYIRAYAKFIRVTTVECEGAEIDHALSSDFTSTGTAAIAATSFQSEGETVKPPRLGEYLLYFFLTKRERVHLIGDLAEEYQEVFSRFGRRSATYWFYKQVFDSLWPLTYRSLRKVTLLDLIGRLLGR
jgi:hypothetical protein